VPCSRITSSFVQRTGWTSSNLTSALFLRGRPFYYVFFFFLIQTLHSGFSYPDGNGTDNEHWSVQRLLKYNGCVLHKWTRDGLPLVIFPLGLSDAKGTAVNNSREDIENGVIVAAEFVGRALIPEMETRIGKRSTAALAFIVDLNGLGLRQFYMPALMLFNGFMSLAHEHYPETLGVVYLINVPTIFQMFWQVVRPFIPERTLKRIHFCSADYKVRLSRTNK